MSSGSQDRDGPADGKARAMTDRADLRRRVGEIKTQGFIEIWDETEVSALSRIDDQAVSVPGASETLGFSGGQREHEGDDAPQGE